MRCGEERGQGTCGPGTVTLACFPQVLLIHILGLTLWGNFKKGLPFTRSCGSPRNTEVRVKSIKKGVRLPKPEAPAHLKTAIFQVLCCSSEPHKDDTDVIPCVCSVALVMSDSL